MLSFVCYEKKWLEQCPDEFNPVYYRRYVDDIFVLFRSRDHFIKFRDYLDKCHPNMKFSFDEDKNGPVCSYSVTYAFLSESTLYSFLNVKELLARNRGEI